MSSRFAWDRRSHSPIAVLDQQQSEPFPLQRAQHGFESGHGLATDLVDHLADAVERGDRNASAEALTAQLKITSHAASRRLR